MLLTNFQLDKDAEQKIREFIPYIHSEDDMAWAANWFLIMGLAMVKLSLEEHPNLSIGDLISVTVLEKNQLN